jgi:hypothetical protein
MKVRREIVIRRTFPPLARTVKAADHRAAEFFRPETFDVVVADTPYRVQHDSRTAAKGLARRPADLLAEAAPVWAGLPPAGRHAGHRVEHVRGRRDEAFRHRVDQAIQRDILVVGKPRRTA